MAENELLQPSLDSDKGAATSIYSTTTGYMAAFFGGPLGGAVIALLNSHRLRRLAVDWPLGVVALAITTGTLWWEVRSGGTRWLVENLGPSGPRVAVRIMGLAMFGIVYLAHGKYYRNMSLFGLKPPSGWVPGIAAIVGGTLAMMGIAMLLAP
ncbi:MAG TPA: hypothetical protein VKB41_11330 [Steroidobacteraceae bacterium]|nr:hypothetical protein [Steroidobacteraceae bacterium]